MKYDQPKWIVTRGLLLRKFTAYSPFLTMSNIGARSVVSLKLPVWHFRSTEPDLKRFRSR